MKTVSKIAESIINESLHDSIIKYFSDPKADLSDKAIHSLSGTLGVDKHKIEEEIYATLHDLMSQK